MTIQNNVGLICLVDIVYDIHRYVVLKGAIFYLWLRISTEPVLFRRVHKCFIGSLLLQGSQQRENPDGPRLI